MTNQDAHRPSKFKKYKELLESEDIFTTLLEYIWHGLYAANGTIFMEVDMSVHIGCNITELIPEATLVGLFDPIPYE